MDWLRLVVKAPKGNSFYSYFTQAFYFFLKGDSFMTIVPEYVKLCFFKKSEYYIIPFVIHFISFLRMIADVILS